MEYLNQNTTVFYNDSMLIDSNKQFVINFYIFSNFYFKKCIRMIITFRMKIFVYLKIFHMKIISFYSFLDSALIHALIIII
jgi:hypothetical protein